MKVRRLGSCGNIIVSFVYMLFIYTSGQLQTNRETAYRIRNTLSTYWGRRNDASNSKAFVRRTTPDHNLPGFFLSCFDASPPVVTGYNGNRVQCGTTGRAPTDALVDRRRY